MRSPKVLRAARVDDASSGYQRPDLAAHECDYCSRDYWVELVVGRGFPICYTHNDSAQSMMGPAIAGGRARVEFALGHVYGHVVYMGLFATRDGFSRPV